MKHHRSPRAWVVVGTLLLLIGAHAALFGLLSRAQLSLVSAAGLLSLVVLKYVWVRSQR
jgi:hypothetical protein